MNKRAFMCLCVYVFVWQKCRIEAYIQTEGKKFEMVQQQNSGKQEKGMAKNLVK